MQTQQHGDNHKQTGKFFHLINSFIESIDSENLSKMRLLEFAHIANKKNIY
jgi:hypothetical protein